MKNKQSKSLAQQAALITALILGSSGWVGAQTNQRPTNQGQYNPGQSTGQYNQGQPGNSGTQMQRQPTEVYADHSTNSQSLHVTKINKGSSLIGATVKNQQGETLGEVNDLVVDFSSGRVAYLVLETDAGILSAEKVHAIPLRAFQPDATGTSLILNANRAQLEASAGFDKDNWPSATSGVWGAQPSWKDDPKTTPDMPTRNRNNGETNKGGRELYNYNNTNKVNRSAQ